MGSVPMFKCRTRFRCGPSWPCLAILPPLSTAGQASGRVQNSFCTRPYHTSPSRSPTPRSNQHVHNKLCTLRTPSAAGHSAGRDDALLSAGPMLQSPPATTLRGRAVW